VFFIIAALLHRSLCIMPDTHTHTHTHTTIDRAKWVPLLVLATRKPVSALLIHSDSAQKVRIAAAWPKAIAAGLHPHTRFRFSRHALYRRGRAVTEYTGASASLQLRRTRRSTDLQ
jgi:hypothetical protein